MWWGGGTDGLRGKQMRGKMCSREESSSTGASRTSNGWMDDGGAGSERRAERLKGRALINNCLMTN